MCVCVCVCVLARACMFSVYMCGYVNNSNMEKYHNLPLQTPKCLYINVQYTVICLKWSIMIFSIFVCILSQFFGVEYEVLSYLCIHIVFFKLSLLEQIHLVLNGLLRTKSMKDYPAYNCNMTLFGFKC